MSLIRNTPTRPLHAVRPYLNILPLLLVFLFAVSCGQADVTSDDATKLRVNPTTWPEIKPLPLDPAIEARIDEILPKLTVEQKVGQTIQADNASITPAEVKQYRLGSILSGGNSAPGPLPYADTKTWVEAADEYFAASVDPEGVEIAIPLIWGIDAVHGHANLSGAIVFPHNVGLGAMRNPDLIEKIAAVTAQELTVSGHDWTFAPTLAVPQNLRWGRSYEGFSEDPAVAKSYADRIVYGLQGRFGEEGFMGPGRVISSAKHFLADGATQDGIDQGDARVTEEELIEVHAAGYYSAIPAGVQTIMSSFSSWNGSKLHGDKELLTDVLKGQLGFNGFIVGDWNGHGQVPGCTNTDCAQSINAGLDMFMAPDSWKGLYESTLQHVKDGTIPMERLDDAVRRILRVKIASGIFEKGAPSTRPNAGNADLLGTPESRAIARQAVRESMVLLKNNGGVLPLDPSKKILVIGDGANSISKASGGWTLSWQGTGHKNDKFPNGEPILAGILETVEAAGGEVIFDASGEVDVAADVVIAVYGEDPYAEFQGDRKTLDFEAPEGFDVKQLAKFKAQGIPLVSVFLSGRPLWTNPEINLSDAFVAAWLPGSEGGGISDLLFQRDPSFDFTGKLSFTWPNTAVAPTNKAEREETSLFPLGYGLSYGDSEAVAQLSESSGIEGMGVASTGEFYAKGAPVAPWFLTLMSGDLTKQIGSFPTSVGGLIISKTDFEAQEDALRVKWSTDDNSEMRLSATDPADMSRQATGSMELAFSAKSFGNEAATVFVGMGCVENEPCASKLPIVIAPGEWKEYRISLNCFADQGANLKEIKTALMLAASPGTDIGIGAVRLATDIDAKPSCEG